MAAVLVGMSFVSCDQKKADAASDAVAAADSTVEAVADSAAAAVEEAADSAAADAAEAVDSVAQ